MADQEEEEISEYEQLRRDRIQRNQDRLKALGLSIDPNAEED